MDKMLKRIEDKFGERVFKKSAMRLKNGPRDLKKFITKNKINHALEIGTNRGITTAFMSQFCKRVTTIDLISAPQRLIGLPYWYDIWDYLEIDNIHFMPVKSDAKKHYLVDRLDFDFAFIDGDHSYKGVKFDFNLVKRCGRVLFHDYDMAPGRLCPVRDFIDSIKEGKFETTKDFAYWESSE